MADFVLAVRVGRDAARVFAEFTAEFEGEGSAGSSRKSRGGFVREGESQRARPAATTNAETDWSD